MRCTVVLYFRQFGWECTVNFRGRSERDGPFQSISDRGYSRGTVEIGSMDVTYCPIEVTVAGN